MKYVKLILLAIITIYLQILLIPSFEIFKNYFNILIPLIILISVKFDETFALITTFSIALLYDVLYPFTLGLNGIIFLIISFVLISYRTFFNFNHFFIMLLLSFAVNLFYYIAIFLFYLFSGEKGFVLSLSFLLMITLNTILTTLLFFTYSFLIRLKLTVADEQ